jgi:acetyl-CoA carboxylase carboxyl transferase subunit beta
MDWFKRRQPGWNPQRRKEMPEGLWTKCEKCEAILYKAELERNYNVCSKCGFHFKVGYKTYIELILDPDSFQEYDAGLQSADPLTFKEKEAYPEYIRKYQERSGLKEAVITGTGRIDRRLVSLSIQDGAFIAASMGSVVGEKVARSIQRALTLRIPLIIIATSGGARMQEGIFSLMQMAKTSLWLTRLSEAKLPFISVITNPTLAGVMASYASLGDFTLAEPGAMMGFAGARVIEQTIRATLPEGFQSAEFFLEHGFVDQVVPRTQLRETILKILSFFPDQGGSA